MKRCLLAFLGSLLLAPTVSAIIDTNNNGLSDLWECAYSEDQEPFDETFDPQADPDADGWTNAQEAAAGTDPFDPNPPDGLVRPETAHIPAAPGEPDENGIPGPDTPEAVTVTWTTLVGKQYTLLFSPDLSAESWFPVGAPFIGNGNDFVYGFATNDTDTQFWRVAVTDVDTDGDGLTDTEESQLDTDSATRDSDHDGVSDWDELMANSTNPLLALDLDSDGMADDLEKHLAKQFLSVDPTADFWGAFYVGLLAGNLDPSHSYTGDNTAIGDLTPVLVAMASLSTGSDMVFIEPQYRQNSLEGSVTAAPPGEPPAATGNYHFSLPGGESGLVQLNSAADFISAYLSSRIGDLPWLYVLGESTRVNQYRSFEWLVGDGYAKFGASVPESGGLVASGELSQRRFRLLSPTIRHGAVTYHYVIATTTEPLDSSAGEQLVSTETITLSIPDGSIASAWVEFKPQISDGVTIRQRVINIAAAVDLNRDGQIQPYTGDDTTTENRPFAFWTNLDYDKGDTVDGDDWEEDDVKMPHLGYQGDAIEPGINWRRDLEDFARLHLDLSEFYPLMDGQGIVDLWAYFEVEDGQTPAINIFTEVPSEGDRNYLTDNDLGSSQIQYPYHSVCGGACATTPSHCLSEMWNRPESGGRSNLIFEGLHAGKGKLVFELRQGDKILATLPPVYMDLRAPQDMYETFTVGDVEDAGVNYADTTWPAATFTQTTGQNLPAPQTAEEKDYILFVHGWNMEPWEKTAYAATMFKRLWHQGYKGRFGAFRWPTFWWKEGAGSVWVPGVGWVPAPDNFNASELRAWNSASRLKELIENRSAIFNVNGVSKVRLYAHSMGNIVASECLRQFGNGTAPVHTYISAQAALSARAWDLLTPTVQPEPVMPDIFGHYWHDGFSHFDATTWAPNVSYLAACYMPTDTIFINHYNKLDWALANWRINTRIKPGAGYSYVPQNGSFLKNDGPLTSHYMSFPDERYDAFSFAAQSYSEATGAEEATQGKFLPGTSKDFTPFFPDSEGDPAEHKYHSGQFRSSIQKRWAYWTQALRDMKTLTP